MNILALDTSQMVYSMICSASNQLITWENKDTSITKAFNMACDTMPDAIVLCNGPGRYSGIRSGMAFAQGISAGLNTPIYTLSAFEIIASKITDAEYWVILDARKQQGYLQAFNQQLAVSEMCIINTDEINHTNCYGTLQHPNVHQVTYNAKDLLNCYQSRSDLKATKRPNAIYIRSATD
ncbi:tRNA (adenosine(37)-N6)-threonylcarbamoyltransferase complex dimerization subunit type 1 TsaB [Gammaproteobacteria bacterium]|nr:tRNA (adenosine(37)-N6)-threonylcarbamoyltransferase complex dimerization subunit type 1 TsaB [Gammaproteobacteria bacterium]